MYKRRTATFTLAAALVLASAIAQAGKDSYQLEPCLKAAQKIAPGDFIKVEFLNPSAEGMASYELELKDKSGQEWEFMCDARHGNIYEIEKEAESAEDPRFKKGMKITEDDAKASVLALYPGDIEELEYELESNGDASYEIDVVDENGTEFKVEVDAASGDIIEVHVEQWEIGEEPDEQL